jgi:L-malate glycosyltransferase
MISVCHILSGDLWAGAEVMDYYLLKNLKKSNRFKISSIMLNEGRLADEMRSIGIPTDIVDEKKHGFLETIREVKRVLIRNSPDIIHSHGYKSNIIAFFSSKKINGIRLISTQHGMPESIGSNNNKKYLLAHKLNILLLSKYFNKIVTVSTDMQDIFINKYGFQKNIITMIHNGTEIPADTSLNTNNGIFRIGSIGRITPIKDYSLMVKIAKEVSRETDKIHFELAGEGPDLEKVRDLVCRYQLEKIFLFRGFVKDREDFYKNLDIYLNTSLHEGIPMSILEAMSYGVPVIAPNVGGLKEILEDGVQGYLVEGRDPKVFSRKCIGLYKNAAMKIRMKCSARERVEKHFSIERMAAEYSDLYNKVYN